MATADAVPLSQTSAEVNTILEVDEQKFEESKTTSLIDADVLPKDEGLTKAPQGTIPVDTAEMTHVTDAKVDSDCQDANIARTEAEKMNAPSDIKVEKSVLEMEMVITEVADDLDSEVQACSTEEKDAGDYTMETVTPELSGKTENLEKPDIGDQCGTDIEKIQSQSDGPDGEKQAVSQDNTQANKKTRGGFGRCDVQPFPASMAKLRLVTVNIGPIKQNDLLSEKLHAVLKLNDSFDIKFELRDKKSSLGEIIKEKQGFVKIPFDIKTPWYLVRIAETLGDLHIDGRDMSVKFPAVFNAALADCKKYVEEHAKRTKERILLKRRQIMVTNVPGNVTMDTIKSTFPDAVNITLNTVEKDGTKQVGSVLMEFATETASRTCMDTNKDVQIGDSKVKMTHQWSLDRKKSKQQKKQRARNQAGWQAAGRRGSANIQNMRNRRARQYGGDFVGMAMRGPRTGRKGQWNNEVSAEKKQPGTQMQTQSPSSTSAKTADQQDPSAAEVDMEPPQSTSGPQSSPQNLGRRRRNRLRFRDRGRNWRARAAQGNRNWGNDQQFSIGGDQFYRGNQSRIAPYRTNQSQYRNDTQRQNLSASYARNQTPSTSRMGDDGEDPASMVAILKTALAHFEEKITQSGVPGGNSGDGQFGNGLQNAGWNQNNRQSGGQGGEQKRKQQYNQDYTKSPKRLYTQTPNNTPNYYGNRNYNYYPMGNYGNNYSIQAGSQSGYMGSLNRDQYAAASNEMYKNQGMWGTGRNNYMASNVQQNFSGNDQYHLDTWQ